MKKVFIIHHLDLTVSVTDVIEITSENVVIPFEEANTGTMSYPRYSTIASYCESVSETQTRLVELAKKRIPICKQEIKKELTSGFGNKNLIHKQEQLIRHAEKIIKDNDKMQTRRAIPCLC